MFIRGQADIIAWYNKGLLIWGGGFKSVPDGSDPAAPLARSSVTQTYTAWNQARRS